MTTTITRPGQITGLRIKDRLQTANITFKGGYAKFFFTDEEIPDGLQLKDKVEVSFVVSEDV